LPKLLPAAVTLALPSMLLPMAHAPETLAVVDNVAAVLALGAADGLQFICPRSVDP
jgi:hypothetical protein